MIIIYECIASLLEQGALRYAYIYLFIITVMSSQGSLDILCSNCNDQLQPFSWGVWLYSFTRNMDLYSLYGLAKYCSPCKKYSAKLDTNLAQIKKIQILLTFLVNRLGFQEEI